ncbi:MAG: DNA mismatch repair protein MutS [Clostridiaceae bacterium]|nr:DNA mismatch repair protein MutS [Clostridiaceae bacterium]
MPVTPMMQQYLDMKEQHKDCILMFRLGDFYEMFFDDAILASRELEITLTGRDCGLDERAPMCGVPYHAVDGYISRLISKGHKVAICEQVEDPALAKGIVKREVVRVVTPGTVTDSSMLDEKRNNYLVCVYAKGIMFGLAVVDISTGEFLTTRITWGNTVSKLFDEITKFDPSEVLINQSLYDLKDTMKQLESRFNAFISALEDQYFEDNYAQETLIRILGENPISEQSAELCTNASGALMYYLEQTHRAGFEHIQKITSYKLEEYMTLDHSTRRNLELTETMREKERNGSLLWVLDRTMTSMGARTLRRWLEMPLINIADINERLDAVAELKDKFMVRMELRELFKRVYDVERLIGRIVLGSANCRDLIALKNSLVQIPYIEDILETCTSPFILRSSSLMDRLEDLTELIDRSIIDDPPVTIKEGGIIKSGYNEEVDRLRRAATDGKQWIAELESSEREKTGIKNLKIGFTKVFGYYLEVTKSYFHLVPDEYIRKQTLANCERYVTPELKDMEESILGAEGKIIDLEYNLFTQIREEIASQVGRVKRTAACLAQMDVLSAMAETADRENYCKPEVNDKQVIKIEGGRHPVVEKMLGQGEFVPNDTYLDMDENRLSIITGPNMAGKSTYMRQVALIALMAQIGSFVPASAAQIGIVDRVFTRVGASDDLAAGQSTFMVEMSEVANILENATSRSLLILDEIGRGTSTFDGLSIAWAVIEYISNKDKVGSRTLFATHYHELTELEDKMQGIKNYCVAVKEKGDDIIFLRKIIRGGADGSYGIQVAKLAGVPEVVTDRAKELLKELEAADISKYKTRRRNIPFEGQVDLFYAANKDDKTGKEVLEQLKAIDISTITPLDAMNVLYDLQKKARRG